MLTQTSMDASTITAWMTEVQAVVRRERDHLTQLDAAIGDGDHGTNMDRGFTAVVAALSEQDGAAPGRLLITAGKTLISTVGGASGPLWGQALRRAGRSLGDADSFETAQLADALDAALAGVVELGAASPGDKTMVDALDPAANALRAAIGTPVLEALEAAAAAAEDGAKATVPMKARKGRASYLGERSIGHPDPGATSAALILRALHATVASG